MSAAAIRLRERLLALRDEQDTASPEFARLDRVATLLESARLAWIEVEIACDSLRGTTWFGAFSIDRTEARRRLSAAENAAEAELRARN